MRRTGDELTTSLRNLWSAGTAAYLAGALAFGGTGAGFAQTSAPDTKIAPAAETPSVAKPAAVTKKHKGFVRGTPLDTLMSTHLTTTVPEARDFVRESRPDPKTLDYAPMSSAEPDPDRPKPRDAANIKALQAELEQSGDRNAKRARGMTKPARHAKNAP